MSEKRFIAGPRTIIEITGAAEKERSRGAAQVAAGGIIKQRRDSDYLPRRKQIGGEMRIFDMARDANGAEIDFLISRELDLSTESSFDTLVLPNINDFLARDQFLFDLIENDNFEGAFFEVKQADADFYRIALSNDASGGGSVEYLTSDSARWTANGFKMPDGLSLLYLDSNENGQNQEWRLNLFSPIYILEGIQKITNVYDFAAETVDFEFQKSDVIFWMPRLATHRVFVEYPNPTGSDYGDFERLLGNQFRFAPRQYYIDNGIDPDVDPTISSVIASYPAEDYQNARAAALWHQNNLSNQRCYQGYYDYAADEWVYSEIEPPNVLPNPPFGSSPSASVNIFNNIVGFYEENGALTAIVKRGNQLFYLWRTGF